MNNGHFRGDLARYCAVVQVGLSRPERDQVLRYCQWIFPNHCQLTPGQLIQHGLKVYGLRLLEEARMWSETHPAGWKDESGRSF